MSVLEVQQTAMRHYAMKKVMRKTVSLVTAFIIALYGATSGFAGTDELSKTATRADRILRGIDDMWRGASSIAVISMRVQTKRYTRKIRMKGWSKGKDKSLALILYPLKEKGTATLKSGPDMYTYLPKTDRTIRLTSAMMMSSWMGSHFTNDDLVKESRLADDYFASITFEGKRNGRDVIEFTLNPKPDSAVVWGKIVMTTGADHIPIESLYYDEELNVARTMTFSGVKEMGGRRIPSVLKVAPADKPGEFTELVYEKIEFDPPLPDSFFSISSIRQR